MKYLFTWNSSYLVKQATKKRKNQFIEKYWDFNLINIDDIDNYDNNYLAESLFTASFLSEKKLVSIEIDTTINEDKANFLINNLDKIVESTILLISFINPDKRSKLYKILSKEFEKKEFNIENENDIYSLLTNKYKDQISDWAKKLIIKYKSNNLDKINSEIEKLLITNNFIEEKVITDNIEPELEESIFIIIDDILNININSAINKINNLLNYTNIYAFYNNLLANIRINVFISKYKNLWVNNNEIWDILNLWNRSFLINKSYKINNKKLEKLYLELVEIDKNMKSWKLMWSDDKDILFEIEKSLIKIRET